MGGFPFSGGAGGGAFLASQIDPGGEVGEELGEFSAFELLRGIAEGVEGVGMGLDDESIGTHGESGTGKSGNEATCPGGMAGVHDDGQVGELLGDGHGAEVEQVARAGIEGAKATLAENDLCATVDDKIFGGGEPFLDGAGESTLEQDGKAGLGNLFE